MAIDFSKYQSGKKSKSKYMSISLSREQVEKVEKYSKKENVRRSQFVREILLAGIASYEEQR